MAENIILLSGMNVQKEYEKGRHFVRKLLPFCYVIGRNDWTVGKNQICYNKSVE